MGLTNANVETDPQCPLVVVDFEANGLSKEVNAVQKEIGAKKKVQLPWARQEMIRTSHSYPTPTYVSF
jgi:hypothetical protein